MYGTFAVAWVFVFFHGTDRATQSLGSALPRSAASRWSPPCCCPAAIALLLERVAYRPLIKKRRAQADRADLGDRRVVRAGRGDGPARPVRRLGRSRRRPRQLRRPQGPRRLLATPSPSNPQGAVHTSATTRVTDVDVLVIVAALLMMVALDQFVRRTRFGRGIRAVAQDPESAALMGVNSTRVVQVTFLIGGLMAGVAATLYMMQDRRDPSERRLHPRRQGVHRRRARRHRQPAGRPARRPAARRHRELRLGGVRHRVEGRRAFVLLVLILLVRPSGLLGESLGKARA